MQGVICMFTNKNQWGMIKLRMTCPQLFSVTGEAGKQNGRNY